MYLNARQKVYTVVKPAQIVYAGILFTVLVWCVVAKLNVLFITAGNTAKIACALCFAANAHSGQYRKGTNIPYISHLTNVMKILCENNCTEEVIVAGILHDVVEDTPVTIEEVEAIFGREVAFLVRGATEVQKLVKIRKDSDEVSWKERKQHTVHFLTEDATPDQLLVSSADKLDNLRSILDDYNRMH